MKSVRSPAVAGLFYPGEISTLRRSVEILLSGSGPAPAEKVQALGVIVPHAGYVYSGAVAAAVYRRIHVPRRVVLLGPNHTGRGAPVAAMEEGEWLFPGGSVPIDQEMGESLRREVNAVSLDEKAHGPEHSLEVQIPFLHALQPGLSILPVILKHLSFSECEGLGEGLARAIRHVGSPGAGEVLIVASSDMTHYESRARAEQQDRLAIDRVLALDPEGLYRTVERHGITMCGFIPAAVMLTAARSLGATKAELVLYATSGDVTKDDSSVVAYAGIVVS